MKKFLRSHPSITIGSLALVFIATLVVFYFWAINDAFTELRLALVPPVPQALTGFDLEGAAKLDLHGVATSSSASAPAPASATVPAPAAASATTTETATTTPTPTPSTTAE